MTATATILPYVTDAAWNKMTELKPNILTIYEARATVMMVAQGQAQVGGIEYSRTSTRTPSPGRRSTWCSRRREPSPASTA